MYKLKSKVIRVTNDPTGDLPEGVFIAKDGGSDVRIEYNGKDYDIHKGEYITLDEDEVKEILFKKLDRLGGSLLGL